MMGISLKRAKELGIPIGEASTPLAEIARQKRVQVPLRGKLVGSLWLTLPWPPTNNTYYRHFRGRTVLSKEGKAYQQAVGEICLETQAGHLEGRLSVRVFCFPADRRARDLDNLWKGLLDSLKVAGVFQDDADIDHEEIRRGAVIEGPAHVIVFLETLA